MKDFICIKLKPSYLEFPKSHTANCLLDARWETLLLRFEWCGTWFPSFTGPKKHALILRSVQSRTTDLILKPDCGAGRVGYCVTKTPSRMDGGYKSFWPIFIREQNSATTTFDVGCLMRRCAGGYAEPKRPRRPTGTKKSLS